MAAHPAPDQLVGGRYLWREQLGRGGFGVVWRAHDTLLQRDVAVKVIEFPAILDDQERSSIRNKVLREARAAARLSHHGLVTVFDVIEEDGRPLIVMELVKAPTLAALVERDGPLPEERVASIGLQVLDALEVAHRQGIIHRDVKPANVMVAESGHVQLTDFGIAAIVDDPKVTNSGALVGSPSYMSPEQARNQPPSAATDLWGLGATLYYALEGEPPFSKDGAIATLTAVVHEPHRPLQRGTELARLIDELLAKDPGARPSSGEVRRRLADVTPGAPTPPLADPSSTAKFDPRPEWGAAPAPVTAPAGPVPPPSPVAPPPVAAPRPAAVPEAIPAASTEAVAASRHGADDRPAATAPSTSPGVPAQTSSRHVEAAAPGAPVGVVHRPDPVRGRRNRSPLVAIVLVGLVLLALVAVGVFTGGRSGRSPSTASQSPDSSAGAPTSRRSGAAPTTAAPAKGAGATPKGWVAYRDPGTGFSIAHPPDWTVSTNGTLTDFRDPASRAYLRVDHREPPGPSPEGAWYDFEPTFAAQNANYHRIQITPTTYAGYRAAIWEYTYSGGGADLHAVDLGFITPGHGFALNFQTAAGDWDRLQPMFDGFKASFKAPSS